MKKILAILMISTVYNSTTAQFVAKMQVKEPIPGLCDDKEVYVMLPSFKGQEEAVCPVSKDSILKRLNAEVSFLKNNPGYNDKGMIGLVVNCKNKVVKCAIDNKTRSAELDKQIETVFGSLGSWKSGKLDGRLVDTSRLFSFKIVDAVFTFD